MRKTQKIQAVATCAPMQRSEASGIHFWDMSRDLVFCDRAAAGLFGFSEADGLRGMPLPSYLERIHSDDLPSVAEAIRDGMVTGEPYHAEYRTVHSDKSVVAVVAIGQWFRNIGGEPFHYSGILFKREGNTAPSPSLEQLLLIARDRATDKGHVETAEKIIDAVACLLDEIARMVRSKGATQ